MGRNWLGLVVIYDRIHDFPNPFVIQGNGFAILIFGFFLQERDLREIETTPNCSPETKTKIRAKGLWFA